VELAGPTNEFITLVGCKSPKHNSVIRKYDTIIGPDMLTKCAQLTT